MPVPAKSKHEFAVDDDVIMDLDGEPTPVKVTKLKSGGNYMVEDNDGSTYECEPHELSAKKAAKKKKAEPEEEEEETPKKKKKAAPEPEEEEEEEEKPAKKKKKPADEEEEEEETKPAKKGKGWFNKTEAVKGKGNVGLPVGKWEALAYNGAAEEKGKGIQVYIEYAGVHDEDVNGKTQRQYFTLVDEKGKPSDGVGYFKGAMETLGFSEEDLEIDEDDMVEELNRLLKKLRKREPWVSITVKEGKGGYNNLYLNGLMDDQEDKPENPLADLPY